VDTGFHQGYRAWRTSPGRRGRRRHQYGARQARQRWHAYADEVPRL